MNATTLTTTARSAFSIAAAALGAIAIFTLAPESTRRREIAAAKRSIAERKAQLANRTAEIETELEQMKAELATTPAPTPEPISTPEPQPEPMPELPTLPNPWELETEITLAPAAIAAPTPQFQLCLPAAPVTATPKAKKTAKPKATKAAKSAPAATPATKDPTIRELKALASQRKIKGYGKMTKAQLLEALNG